MKSFPAFVFGHLPPTMKLAMRWVNRVRPGNRPAWGTLRRHEPLGVAYGFDRGLPVDRVFIERFLERNQSLITGDVLEFGDSVYVKRFGSALTNVDVCDIRSDNPAVTIVADVGAPGTLPVERFDCIVMTQVLQFVADDRQAINNVWRALKPGGTLLITVPTGGRQMLPFEGTDYRRYLEDGLRQLLSEVGPSARLDIGSFGGLVAKIADLHGLAAEELDPHELKIVDQRFPVIAAGVLTKPLPDPSCPAAS